MKSVFTKTILIASLTLLLPQISIAQNLDLNKIAQPDVINELPAQSDSIIDEAQSEIQKIDVESEIMDNSEKESKDANPIMSPWSVSAFYLYNFNDGKQLLVPSPGYEKNGFKANAQAASYSFEKIKGFESKVSTNWSIGQNENAEDKLIFKANASVKRRVVVAVPFLEVSKGLSFNTNYTQINTGASSFIPTPWFFILPKYTATYNNAEMNQFEYGVSEAGWSSGWGVTLLKPINKNWTFLSIYSGKKLSEDLRITDESKQSLMMILSYQFDDGWKLFK